MAQSRNRCEFYTIAKKCRFCTKRAAARKMPPSSSETPENIDSDRYPYVSTRTPLIGAFAIALRIFISLKFPSHPVEDLRQCRRSRDRADGKTKRGWSSHLRSTCLLKRQDTLELSVSKATSMELEACLPPRQIHRSQPKCQVLQRILLLSSTVPQCLPIVCTQHSS